ncbi:MAG: hypothetical protein AAFU77_16650, partial [Myxococcota bacterium]
PSVCDHLLSRFAPFGLHAKNRSADCIRDLVDAVASGDVSGARDWVERALGAGRTPGAVLVEDLQRVARRFDIARRDARCDSTRYAVSVSCLRLLACDLSRRMPTRHLATDRTLCMCACAGSVPLLDTTLHAIYARVAGWRVFEWENIDPHEALSGAKAPMSDVVFCAVANKRDLRGVRALRAVFGPKCFVVGSQLDSHLMRQTGLSASRILFDPRETLELLTRLER